MRVRVRVKKSRWKRRLLRRLWFMAGAALAAFVVVNWLNHRRPPPTVS